MHHHHHHQTTHAAFASAIEARDADTLVAAYAEDAVITLLDRDHPPAAPLVLAGRRRSAPGTRDVCGRNIEHTVPVLVEDAGGFAFEEHCRYPEGAEVVCLRVATVEDGRSRARPGPDLGLPDLRAAPLVE